MEYIFVKDIKISLVSQQAAISRCVCVPNWLNLICSATALLIITWWMKSLRWWMSRDRYQSHETKNLIGFSRAGILTTSLSRRTLGSYYQYLTSFHFFPLIIKCNQIQRILWTIDNDNYNDNDNDNSYQVEAGLATQIVSWWPDNIAYTRHLA